MSPDATGYRFACDWLKKRQPPLEIINCQVSKIPLGTSLIAKYENINSSLLKQTFGTLHLTYDGINYTVVEFTQLNHMRSI